MDWQKVADFFMELGKSLGTRLLGALLLLIIGLRLIKWVKKKIRNSPKVIKLEDGVESFLTSFISITMYVSLFVSVALVMGVPATSFLAVLASCGVAIGLAMQGALSNFAGGIMILMFKPFKVGDYIATTETSGTVKAITVVYTVLGTPDNKIITIPNGTLTNSVVENYSAMEKRRIDLDFSVSYDSDTEEVKGLLLEIAKKHPLVLDDPTPMARMSEQNRSALVFTMRAWCKTDDYWDVRFDLVEATKAVFDKKGIKVPYQQLDVHLNK